MSRVLPILFNTDMVRAILDERKTVTRRLIKKSQYDGLCKVEPTDWNLKCLKEPWHSMTYQEFIKSSYTPPYQPGDILYVRETWRIFNKEYFFYNQTIEFEFKDGTHSELVHIEDKELFKRLVECVRDERRSGKHCYHPSIHMQKKAARIYLKATNVRVERLCNMLKADFLSEGLELYKNDGRTEKTEIELEYEFEDLWNSTINRTDINRYGWDASPWVWVIEFERCDKPDSV